MITSQRVNSFSVDSNSKHLDTLDLWLGPIGSESGQVNHKGSGLKPIFRCNANYLASGVSVGQCPQRQIFVLEIPTCWYILVLPPTPIPDANPKICITPTPTPDASQWNIGGVGPSGVGACVGHVHFMLFMSISFAWGNQRKLVFQWNVGLMVPPG